MFEQFTDRARRVMGLANHEAVRFNHESIGTEHILLGLIKEASGVAANVLRDLGVDLKRVRMEIEKKVPAGEKMVAMGRLPFRPRAKKVIELAFEEARALGHNYVGTEHLLLGLLRESEGVAAQVLVEQGLKLDEVREEVMRLLCMEAEPEVSTPQAQAEIAPGGRTANAEEARRKSALEGFTDESRMVMGLAGQEAKRLDRREVDANHLFLGLMRQAVHDDSSVAARVLRNLGVDAGRVRTAAEKRVAIEQEAGTAACFPLTQEAYKAIQMAREESKALGHDYLGPEHLLLGLLEERQSAAAEVFAEQGIQCERVREQVRRVTGTK